MAVSPYTFHRGLKITANPVVRSLYVYKFMYKLALQTHTCKKSNAGTNFDIFERTYCHNVPSIYAVSKNSERNIFFFLFLTDGRKEKSTRPIKWL